jgi:hypothetical protein
LEWAMWHGVHIQSIAEYQRMGKKHCQNIESA